MVDYSKSPMFVSGVRSIMDVRHKDVTIGQGPVRIGNPLRAPEEPALSPGLAEEEVDLTYPTAPDEPPVDILQEGEPIEPGIMAEPAMPEDPPEDPPKSITEAVKAKAKPRATAKKPQAKKKGGKSKK